MPNDLLKKCAIAIDGSSLSYRAYYATINYAEKYSPTEIENQATNAVKLMLVMCFKLLKMQPYAFSLVAFDTQAPTFRKDALAKYKSNRKGMPASLVKQLPLIVESLRYAGFTVMAVDGQEADDLIGSFVQLMRKHKIHTNIFSSDHDLLQLVSEDSSLFMPIKGVSEMKEYNMQNFAKLCHGLSPEQIPLFKALAGDPSDNYDGVKGIGKKGAIRLVNKYKTLEDIYSNSLNLPKKQHTQILEQATNLELCLELSLIKRDYFNDLQKIDDFILKPLNHEAMKEFLKKYSINGIEKYF